MAEWLQSVLGQNTLLTGGLTLALLGLAAVWLRDVPGKLLGWAKHFLITTLTVDSRDELMFPALVEYMDSRESLRRLNNFTARAVRQGTAYQSLHDELQQGVHGIAVPLVEPGGRCQASLAILVPSLRASALPALRKAPIFDTRRPRRHSVLMRARPVSVERDGEALHAHSCHLMPPFGRLTPELGGRCAPG